MDAETTDGEPTTRFGKGGGQVRKGEKGTQVLFFTDRNSRAAKDDEGKTLKNKEGKTIYEEQKREKPICKQYTVFNVEQAEGLKLKAREDPSTARMGRSSRRRESDCGQRADRAARCRRSRLLISLTKTR